VFRVAGLGQPQVVQVGEHGQNLFVPILVTASITPGGDYGPGIPPAGKLVGSGKPISPGNKAKRAMTKKI